MEGGADASRRDEAEVAGGGRVARARDEHGPEPAEVPARVTWPGGGHGWRWQGTVAADSCVRTGTLSFVVPDAPGPLALDLELVAAVDPMHAGLDLLGVDAPDRM